MKKYNWDETNVITMSKDKEVALYTNGPHVWYGDNEAIKGADLEFEKNKITTLIDPSGYEKSTCLRSLDRMDDGIASTKIAGKIMYEDVDINAPQVDVYEMHKQADMMFQHLNPFSKSIYDNIIFASKQHDEKSKKKLDEIVETSLKRAALWDQIEDSLDKSALTLSGGQQQHLRITRAIAMKPDILLLDEPASVLDPTSTGVVEKTLVNLKEDYTIIIMAHNMQQAARISDYTAFFYLGKVMEHDKTNKIFIRPKIQAVEDYVSGHFG